MEDNEAVLRVKGEETKVALKDVRIETEIKDIAARTTITQTFKNTEERAIEAVYCFPVEESASVCDFKIVTNGKVINGKVEEKDKAFEEYDNAIENGDASYLLDQEKEDILIVSVGNIKPSQEVKVCISYVSELPVYDGVIRLQIPTTVSPRYAPPGEDPVVVDAITPPYVEDVPYGLSIKVRLLSAPVKSIESPSHDIQVTTADKYTLVQSDSLRLDQDFILEITTFKQKDPFCIVSCHENGEKALLLRFSPELDESIHPTEQRREVLFIIDCSGSMRGSSITEAKNALALALRSMNHGDFFNILRFGTTYELFKSESVEYDTSSLRQALNYIEFIDANLCGTKMSDPIDYICRLNQRKDVVRDVILLTDGQVSNTDSIIRKVSTLHGKVRFFTVGIGYGASQHLVKGIARVSGGVCEMVQPGEKIEPKVIRQFSRMGQAPLENVKFSIKNGEVELPEHLPPLFDGDDYTMFAKVIDIKDNATVQFSATCDGENYTWNSPVINAEKDNTIPVLWALSRVKEHKDTIEAGYIEDGSRQLNRKMRIVQKSVTELGLKYNILTDYTSFLAVEKRKEGEKENSAPDYRGVPVLMTRDLYDDTTSDFFEKSGKIISSQLAMRVETPLQMPQTMKLAPMLARPAEILQLSAKELIEYIMQELEENPVLDVTLAQQSEISQCNENEIVNCPNEKRRDADGVFEGKEMPAENAAAMPMSLHNYLFDQLDQLGRENAIEDVCGCIIYGIDNNGYLQRSLDEITKGNPYMAAIGRIDDALNIVQSMEPRGVGARDLKECLMLQLDKGDDRFDLASKLITDHLEDIEAKKYSHIANKINVDLEKVKNVINLINTLNPRPGSVYGTEALPDVIPEVKIELVNGKYEVALLNNYIPQIYINDYYKKVLDKKSEPEMYGYVQKKINSARWLIDALEQRRLTIYIVTNKIFAFQYEFLDKGVSHRKVLKMQDVADAIGIHVSTVSKAISHKYVQTPQGTFELKFFFTKGVKTDDELMEYWENIRQKLVDIIANEDKKNPLSDEGIMKSLKGSGIDITRRTIAKYRRMMKIPSSRMRRVY